MSSTSTVHGAPRLRFLVVGSQRSGTTLVQRLLAESSGTCVPPETHFFSLLVPSLSGAGTDEIAARLDAYLATPQLAWIEVPTGAVRRRLVDLLVARRWVEAFARLLDVIADTDADVVGEKTPNHMRWCAYLLEAIPDLRVVGVVRDPRAVVNSRRDVPWGSDDPFAQAMHWRLDASLLGRLQRAHADRVLVVRYEDLVHAPEPLRARLTGFLGVTDRPRRSPGPLFGPDEVWKQRALGPVDATRADVWRHELAKHTAAAVAAICWPEMLAWGYDPRMSRIDRAQLAVDCVRRRPRSCLRVLSVARNRSAQVRAQANITRDASCRS